MQSGTSKAFAGLIFFEGGTYNLTATLVYLAGTISFAGNFARWGGTRRLLPTGLYLGSSQINAADLPGSYNLSGSGFLSSANLYLGGDGLSGDFTESGGTNSVGGILSVGDYEPR